MSRRVPLERLTVGRKTPRDGKLEVAPETAERLRALGSAALAVTVRPRGGGNAQRANASVTSMDCTCEKGRAAGQHVHHFLSSPLFLGLAAGSLGVLDLVGAQEVELRIIDDDAATDGSNG